LAHPKKGPTLLPAQAYICSKSQWVLAPPQQGPHSRTVEDSPMVSFGKMGNLNDEQENIEGRMVQEIQLMKDVVGVRGKLSKFPTKVPTNTH